MKIEIKNINKSMKQNQILNNISCFMDGNKIYGIYGHNGSGKTMLMRCILGLVHIDSGKIIIDGNEIGKDIDFPPNVGAMIETPGFFPYATGFENLKMLAEIQGKIGEEEIKKAMDRVGLQSDDKRTVSKYSLGMRQRLAIAQAIMEAPDLLVLDEPTNALDEDGVEMFRNIMLEELKRGALIVLCSHNKEDIEVLADVKIKMSSGKIVEITESDKK